MWVGMFHLAIGNLILGVIEGAVLARLLRISMPRCVAMMIAANYASAWAGAFVLPALHFAIEQGLGGPSISHERWLLWGIVLLAWPLTLVIETPFAMLAARGRGVPVRRVLARNCLLQTGSVVLLFAGYFWISPPTLLTRTRVDPSLSFVPKRDDAWVYYIRADGTAVERVRIDGSDRQVVAPLDSGLHADRLLGSGRGSEGTGTQLEVRSEELFDPPLKELDLPPRAAAVPADDPEAEFDRPQRLWFEFRTSHEDSTMTQGIEARAGFWGIEGLSVVMANRRNRYALETPVVAWYARNPIVTRDGLVIFEFYRDQVVVLDPQTSTLGLLARGYGAALVFDAQGTNAPARDTPRPAVAGPKE